MCCCSSHLLAYDFSIIYYSPRTQSFRCALVVCKQKCIFYGSPPYGVHYILYYYYYYFIITNAYMHVYNIYIYMYIVYTHLHELRLRRRVPTILPDVDIYIQSVCRYV